MHDRIAITGAAGGIGTVLRQGLQDLADRLVLVDQQEVEDPADHEQVVVGDIADEDAMAAAFAGCDAVVHLAGIPNEAPFHDIAHANLVGAHGVFEGARRAVVRRVVFASTNHVTGFYPTSTRISPDAPVRPDTFYGASKAFGEALGRLYHDKWGLEVVCLRIGSFRERPEDVRQLSTWLGHDDAIQLFSRAVGAPDVGWLVAYGVSDNAASWWDNAEAAALLGYQPTQRAEAHRESIDPEPEDVSLLLDRQGGPFVAPGYTGPDH